MQLVSALLSSTVLTAPRPAIWVTFSTSQVFTPTADLNVRLHVLGPVGSGAAGYATTGGVNAAGAGAGGYAIKETTLKAGVSYTVTIGAAGAAVVANVSGQRSNGNDGSPTSFVGGSLNIVANGGKGGQCTASNVPALGGLGGTASGGDKNFTGGRAGNIAANATVINALMRATGGGGYNLFGLSECNGGDITGSNVTSSQLIVSGGGSCAGNAPSVSQLTSNAPQGGDLALLGAVGSNSFTLLNPLFGQYSTIGPSGQINVNAGPFGGSGGTNAPLFGGGAGAASVSGAITAYGQNNIGGAPGGAATASSSAAVTKGKDGIVYMELLG